MSAVCGYGICTDEIKTSIAQVKALIAMSDKVNEELSPDFAEGEEECETAQEFAQWLSDGGWADEDAGLATILAEVIKDCEGVNFLGTSDAWCNCFLVFPESYPWKYTEKDMSMTEEKLNEIFHKYVSVLTDLPVDIKEQTIEYD